MAKKVLNEIVANYDFKQEVTTPVEELLGIEIQFPTAVSIDLKEEFIYKFGTLVEEKNSKFLGCSSSDEKGYTGRAHRTRSMKKCVTLSMRVKEYGHGANPD